ncbi:MAG: NAD(P)/FAD-dependent oxidoreductase [Clostridiales bacterium]|nr:NAD(P)/FAD-dependent oxidoreductase [Clostridiales bacterium]
MAKIFVIGGGASGMMAAIVAARKGHKVTIFEKNEKLGKKLYITGKGRCNLTNACDRDTFFNNVISNPKFLYRSFQELSTEDTLEFFEDLGLKTKVERGNRVFPLSDKSSDVIAVLRDELNRLGVEISYRSEVIDIICENKIFKGIKLNNSKEVFFGDAIIIATGGLSYPLTGSTGDGFKFAKKFGHSVTELSPSLVPLYVAENFIKDLMGLSLKNIAITAYSGNKKIYSDFGELLFTHFGLSGPVILSTSRYIIPYMDSKASVRLSIDLKPALSHKQLDARILRDFNEAKNKQFKNSLGQLLPNKLIDVIIRLSYIDPDKQVNSITKEERLGLVNLLKNFTFNITKLAPYNQAVITKGGVNIKEINPSTMESKLIKNMYFAGEVLDLDALTGGFNLQIAWSTGYLAGKSAASIID